MDGPGEIKRNKINQKEKENKEMVSFLFSFYRNKTKEQIQTKMILKLNIEQRLPEKEGRRSS